MKANKIIIIEAIAAIALLEAIALIKGIDGILLTTSVAVLAGLAGWIAPSLRMGRG